MRPSDVGEYLTAQGRCFASSEELCALLGVAPAVLPSSLRRAVARGDFVKVCRGGWAARDDRCRQLGSGLPDLERYVDDMMEHLGHRYYLGFNAAALLYGVAHRYFTTTVVVTSSRTVHRSRAQIEARHSGRAGTRVVYMHAAEPHRRGMNRRRMPEAFYGHDTFVNYSTPEVTLLDMVQRPDLAGGLDQVATVACGLVEHGLLDSEILASQALTYPATVRQRAGHILDEGVAALDMTGVTFDSGPLASTLTARAVVTPLMPGVGRFFPVAYDDAAPLRVDERWRVRVNALLDPDT